MPKLSRLKLKEFKQTDKIVWCNSVDGENNCHLSTAPDRALLITPLVPGNSAFDCCEAKLMVAQRIALHSSVFQQKQGPKTERESTKSQTKPVRILQPLDGKTPSELLQRLLHKLCLFPYSTFRHSRFCPELILTN